MERVVVVGAGLAGMHTVKALRTQGFAGELVLVGAEVHPPYDRPPLSKAVLLGEADSVPLPFDTADLGVDLRLDVRATGLGDGVLETTSGEVGYDGLAIATGAEPIRLPGDGALYLRTRDDALALRAALRPGASVTVVGAGWIGAEVATAAARHGCRVTVVEQAVTPVAHALPAEVGQHLAPWYAESGIDLRCGVRVDVAHAGGVDLSGGDTLPADVVVVGIGVRAATGWLAGADLDIDRGILVGPDLAATRARVKAHGLVAVGDAAARWSTRYGTRIRGEHWDDALRSPAVAAATLLGRPATYDPVPYVWSEQFGRFVQFAGHPGPDDRLVWRGDPTRDAAWSACWLTPDGAIAALLAVDRPRDLVQGRRLAEAGAPVDVELLTDPAVSVREAVAGLAG